MKVNITLDANDVRSGMTNFNPTADPNSSTQIRVDIDNLTMFIDDNEAEEIIAMDILDFVNPAGKDQILSHWISKLAHGASITLGGRQIYDVVKLIHRREIDLQQANFLIYGNDMARRAMLSADFLCDVLKEKGLTVESIKFDNTFYCVKAVRP